MRNCCFTYERDMGQGPWAASNNVMQDRCNPHVDASTSVTSHIWKLAWQHTNSGAACATSQRAKPCRSCPETCPGFFQLLLAGLQHQIHLVQHLVEDEVVVSLLLLRDRLLCDLHRTQGSEVGASSIQLYLHDLNLTAV